MLANQRVDIVAKIRHLGVFACALCAAVLLVILPATIHRRIAAAPSSSSIASLNPHDVVDASTALESIERRQKVLLHNVMGLQDRVAKLTADVKALNQSSAAGQGVKQVDTGATISAEDRAFNALSVRCGLDAFRAEVSKMIVSVAELEEESKQYFTSAMMGNRRHYLVKWHGLSGVDTTEPLYSESDAELAYERVGDFAKKMLLFEPQGGSGGTWSVARAYGGENWLSLMSNDGTIQHPADKKAGAPEGGVAPHGRIPVV